MDALKKTALLAIIVLISDAVKDTAAALQPGQSMLAKLSGYGNLVADITALVPQLGDVPAQVAALQPTDYVDLVGDLVTKLSITNPKAEAIVEASLGLLSEIAGPVLSKVEALAAAIKA